MFRALATAPPLLIHLLLLLLPLLLWLIVFFQHFLLPFLLRARVMVALPSTLAQTRIFLPLSSQPDACMSLEPLRSRVQEIATNPKPQQPTL